MPAIVNLAAEFGAGIIGTSSLATGGYALTLSAGATGGGSLLLNRTVLSNATAPLITLNVGSTASVPAIMLEGQSFVSAVSILFTTGGVNGTGAIAVLLPDGQTRGWIPVLPPAAVTAAARG